MGDGRGRGRGRRRGSSCSRNGAGEDTPPPPIAVEVLTQRAVFTDDVELQIRNKPDSHGTHVANSHHPSRTVVAKLTVQPGAQFPWHTHPGPVIVNVAQGELTYIMAEDCVDRPYAAGTAFVDPGRGMVHTAVNRTGEVTVLLATFFEVPQTGPLTIPVELRRTALPDGLGPASARIPLETSGELGPARARVSIGSEPLATGEGSPQARVISTIASHVQTGTWRSRYLAWDSGDSTKDRPADDVAERVLDPRRGGHAPSILGASWDSPREPSARTGPGRRAKDLPCFDVAIAACEL